MFVMMRGDGLTFCNGDLVAAGFAAVDAAVHDDLSGLEGLVKRPDIALAHVMGIFVLRHWVSVMDYSRQWTDLRQAFLKQFRNHPFNCAGLVRIYPLLKRLRRMTVSIRRSDVESGHETEIGNIHRSTHEASVRAGRFCGD